MDLITKDQQRKALFKLIVRFDGIVNLDDDEDEYKIEIPADKVEDFRNALENNAEIFGTIIKGNEDIFVKLNSILFDDQIRDPKPTSSPAADPDATTKMKAQQLPQPTTATTPDPDATSQMPAKSQAAAPTTNAAPPQPPPGPPPAAAPATSAAAPSSRRVRPPTRSRQAPAAAAPPPPAPPPPTVSPRNTLPGMPSVTPPPPTPAPAATPLPPPQAPPPRPSAPGTPPAANLAPPPPPPPGPAVAPPQPRVPAVPPPPTPRPVPAVAAPAPPTPVGAPQVPQPQPAPVAAQPPQNAPAAATPPFVPAAPVAVAPVAVVPPLQPQPPAHGPFPPLGAPPLQQPIQPPTPRAGHDRSAILLLAAVGLVFVLAVVGLTWENGRTAIASLFSSDEGETVASGEKDGSTKPPARIPVTPESLALVNTGSQGQSSGTDPENWCSPGSDKGEKTLPYVVCPTHAAIVGEIDDDGNFCGNVDTAKTGCMVAWDNDPPPGPQI